MSTSQSIIPCNFYKLQTIKQMNKPKYQIGDEVWLIKNNKIQKKIIRGIYEAYRKKFFETYLYFFMCDTFIDEGKWPDNWHKEKELFSSKEKLIANL